MTAVRALLDVALSLGALALLVPQVVVLVETLAALLPRARDRFAGGPVTPPTAVLIPAHNEAAAIGATVRSLAAQLGPEAGAGAGHRLIVIADNCGDDTASLARAAGATVIERTDAEARGKGFAIAFALQHLDADPPEVVVLVDADCRVSDGGLPTLARVAAALGRPIQAEYLIQSPARPSPVAVVSGLAVMIRNRVRPRGLARLGLPCHLTGSGMAFPWKVLREAPAMKAELVEDLVMGIQMALRDDPPLFCPEVQVTSDLPETREANMSQRRRWEHGQLNTLMKYFPRLIGAGLARGRPGLLGLGFDLVVPPLALLVMLQLGALAISLATAAGGLTSWLPATLAGVGMAAMMVAIGSAWLVFGRQVAPLKYALFIPFYVLWKVPLYLSLALKGKQKTWQRTARPSETEPPR